MAYTETQKKLAQEVAEGAPSTDAARKNLEIDPPAAEPNNIDGAPVYPEPKQKTPEEMATNPKEFLNRLDEATAKPEAHLARRGDIKVGDYVGVERGPDKYAEGKVVAVEGDRVEIDTGRGTIWERVENVEKQ